MNYNFSWDKFESVYNLEIKNLLSFFINFKHPKLFSKYI